MKRTVSWIQEPKQERSQRTLDAFLDVTEELLAKRPFHEIPIGDIIEAAESSAGSFYARFKDKRALLHALHERVSARIGRLAECFTDIPQSASRDEAIQQIVSAIAAEHDSNRGVLRAAMVESIHDPQFAARALANGQQLLLHVSGILERFRGAEASGPFGMSVAFGLRIVLAVLDQQMFVPDRLSRAVQPDDAELLKRLTHAFAGALDTAGKR